MWNRMPHSSSLREPQHAAGFRLLRDEEFETRIDAFGVFSWWPGDDTDWLHPYDRPLAEDFIPSDRVWRRHRGEGEFFLLVHGDVRFRARARLWRSVPQPRFWVDDVVEVRSEHARRLPFIGRVIDIRWNALHRRHEYWIERRGRLLHQRCLAEHLIRLKPLPNLEGEAWPVIPIGDDVDAFELQASPPEV